MGSKDRHSGIYYINGYKNISNYLNIKNPQKLCNTALSDLVESAVIPNLTVLVSKEEFEALYPKEIVR